MHQEFKNIKSFPDASMSVLSTYNFSTCAVVGSSGSLMNATFGAPFALLVFLRLKARARVMCRARTGTYRTCI